MNRFRESTLRKFSEDCLTAVGVRSDHSATAVDLMLFADRRGHASHGIVRLPVYGKRVVAGAVETGGEPAISREFGAVALVDGGNLLGPVVGSFSIARAIGLAESFGIGLVLANHSNHYGAAAYYTLEAVKRGMVGISASNAPPNMAPFGGRERFLGTNPLSIAVPTRTGSPFVLDMASSVVARGKIILAAQKGEKIPEGWALDPEGRVTTDAADALLGCVLPFGGAKGSAISMLIDILGGLISGASFGRHLNTLEDLTTQQNLGQVFIVINPDVFQDRSVMLDRMDDLIHQLKSTPRAEGFQEILYPGEIEHNTEARIGKEGIPLSDDVLEQLNDFSFSLDLPELKGSDAIAGTDMPLGGTERE